MQIAWVSGSTGLVGRALVTQLLAQGVRTYAHVRPDSKDIERWQSHFAGLGAQVVLTPWQQADISEALTTAQVDTVFCCIGTTKARMHSDGEAANSYETVDFGLTRTLALASAAAKSVQRLVYLSSEGASADAVGAYLQWRWKAEQAVQTSGISYTIARAPLITGERDTPRLLEGVAASALVGILKVLSLVGAKQTAARYQSISGEDLAFALRTAAVDPSCANQVLRAEQLSRPVHGTI